MRDLRWFNRWFGGIATSREMIATIARKTGKIQLSLLEVAAGDGFLPRTLVQNFASSGIHLDVTLLDRAASHLPRNGVGPKIAGDALSLPFRDSAFDLVSTFDFRPSVANASSASETKPPAQPLQRQRARFGRGRGQCQREVGSVVGR